MGLNKNYLPHIHHNYSVLGGYAPRGITKKGDKVILAVHSGQIGVTACAGIEPAKGAA